MTMRRNLLAVLLASHGHAAPRPGGHPNIWNFSGKLDGNTPRGDLLVDVQGNLYGTTSVGGTSGNGVVFEVVPPAGGDGAGTETTLWNFTGSTDGSTPSGGLVADAQGDLYGTAATDGASLAGTVFELSPPAPGSTSWTETTLCAFGAGHDGRNPVGNLVLGPDGTLFGTTNWGGTGGQGTAFKVVPPGGPRTTWTETVIWNFTGGTDGGQPVASLIFDAAGNLYGTTKTGGANGQGTVFELMPSPNPGWTQTTLWSFTGGTDGGSPTGTLSIDANGALYGTTQFGGALSVTCAQALFPYYGESPAENEPALSAAYVPAGGNECGTVFQLSPPAQGQTAWTLSTLYALGGVPDGGNPAAGLTLLSDGSLVGLATQLGPRFYGAAFEVTPPAEQGQPWGNTQIASFLGKKNGFYPRGGLALGLAGRLYGTMSMGGSTWTHHSIYGYGAVYSVAPISP